MLAPLWDSDLRRLREASAPANFDRPYSSQLRSICLSFRLFTPRIVIYGLKSETRGDLPLHGLFANGGETPPPLPLPAGGAAKREGEKNLSQSLSNQL